MKTDVKDVQWGNGVLVLVLPRKQSAKIVALEPTVKIAAVPMQNHCVKNAAKEGIWKQWGHTAVTVTVVSRARQGTYKM